MEPLTEVCAPPVPPAINHTTIAAATTGPFVRRSLLVITVLHVAISSQTHPGDRIPPGVGHAVRANTCDPDRPTRWRRLPQIGAKCMPDLRTGAIGRKV